MIKICYIVGHLGKGGAERQLYELVSGINNKKFYPLVINLNQGGYWGREIQKLNVTVIELQRRKNVEFSRLFKLIKLLKEIKPDIVHTYMFAANSYGRVAALIAKVPIIIASERNIIEASKDESKCWIYIDRILSSLSHGIICNSLKAAESLVEKYSFDARKVFGIHNGINITDFVKELRINGNGKFTQKVVGTVGRLYSQKNHRLFLEMARIVTNRFGYKEIKFIIIGDGPLKNELEDYSQKLGISKRVVFLGDRNDIPDLLQKMDVFILSSNWEGLPNAVMEAMASGLPCVVTNVGGNSELVLDGETGYVVPPNDPEAMSRMILYLLENDELAKEMGEAGRKRVVKDFNMEKMIRKTEEVYKNLMAGKIY